MQLSETDLVEWGVAVETMALSQRGVSLTGKVSDLQSDVRGSSPRPSTIHAFIMSAVACQSSKLNGRVRILLGALTGQMGNRFDSYSKQVDAG